MKSSTQLRVALLTLAAMGIAAIPVVWGSNQGVATMFNAPLQWIARDSPARRQFNRFLDHFESHEMVLVSWPGCTVDDPRQEEVAEAIMAASKEQAVAGQPELVTHVLTGYSMLRMLQDDTGLTKAEALPRMKGSLVGAGGRTSCIVVAITEEASVQRRHSVPLILDAVQRTLGIPREWLRVAGPPIDGLATDDESIRSLQRYSIPAIVISLLLCCVCLRSVWLTLPILAVGALGQAAMLAMVYFLGITMNAILIVLPALVFVLTVSAGVHVVNYYYDELRTGSGADAISRAMAKALAPCSLAAITTTIGLVSLTVSDVAPVGQFGALAGLGVLATVLLLFLLLPGSMELRRRFYERRAGELPRPAPRHGRAGLDFGRPAAAMIWRYARWITLASFVLLLVGGMGSAWLRTTINVVSLLAPENRAVQDFRWFEKHIGPLVPVEVVIHFDRSCPLDQLQRLEFVRSAQSRISEIDILSGAMSAASFFPAIPKPGGIRATMRRTVLRRRLEDAEKYLVQAQYLHVTSREQSWRISARVLGLEDFDYVEFLNRLRERVTPLIAEYEESDRGGITATYTGLTAVVYAVERALLADLFDSFLTALALVTTIMMVALRSVRAGLIAMVPNVFPMLILFGTMGWMDRPVDIGTVMTASVALGMAVDGTFHFLKWFRHEVALGQTRREAIEYAYRHCGRALVQSTVICACGMLVFGLSNFLPARHFAVHLMLLLWAALVGDLVVLPALLAGPLGRFFVRRGPDQETTTHSAFQVTRQ